jgi:glutaredoxin 3
MSHGAWKAARRHERACSVASTDRPAGEGIQARAFCVVRPVKRIQIYTTRWCGYCVRAKALMDDRGLEYEEVSLDDEPGFRAQLHERTGGWTVPQILVDDEPIGGFAELWSLDRSGRLAEKVAA